MSGDDSMSFEDIYREMTDITDERSHVTRHTPYCFREGNRE